MEIPEIKEGTYRIPQGCIAASWKGILTIRKNRKQCLENNRCKNCINFGKGYTTRYGSLTTVCFNMPKTVKSHNREVYYSARPLTKACNMFEPRNNDNQSAE